MLSCQAFFLASIAMTVVDEICQKNPSPPDFVKKSQKFYTWSLYLALWQECQQWAEVHFKTGFQSFLKHRFLYSVLKSGLIIQATWFSIVGCLYEFTKFPHSKAIIIDQLIYVVFYRAQSTKLKKIFQIGLVQAMKW